MSIESTLRSLILDDATLASLIEERFYPVYRSQGERRACITYQQIGGSDLVTTDGFLGLIDARFQLTCFAVKHSDCVTLAAACVTVLKNAVAKYEDITIQAVNVSEPADLPILNDQAEQLTMYARMIDYTLSYNSS